jgi:hypothetical protein
VDLIKIDKAMKNSGNIKFIIFLLLLILVFRDASWSNHFV